MWDFILNDKPLSTSLQKAINAAEQIADVSYLFSETTLNAVLSDLLDIRNLQAEVNKRLDQDRVYTALLLQNLNAGFPVEMVKPLFVDKLPSERVEQVIEQFKQGEFKANQVGLNAVKTATVRDSDKAQRGSLDWSLVQRYLEDNGVNVQLWSNGNLAKANGAFASFRRIAKEILAGNKLSSKDLGVLRDGPKTRDNEIA